MHKSLFASAFAALAVLACSESPTAVDTEIEPSLSAATGRPDVAGRFIITLRERTDPAAVARDHGVGPDYIYRHALTGFAGRVSDAARQGLLRDNRVVRVEADGIATVVTLPTTQSGATWGLDRLDQTALPLSGSFSYTNNGAGVKAYIIDTGIRFSHAEFAGRATSGFDAVNGGSADDCNGHGTHVAGTVAGTTYGVAKGATLVGVRVLDCGGSGTWSGVIAGIDWVARDHAEGTPAVANLSLGGGANSSVDQAVKNMIADGVATAIAAGNGNQGGKAQDACKYSPARVAEGMTIGATTQTDVKPRWSNYGNCVDWFAPGVSITSAWYTGDVATNTISGTSMATPHTAGVAALYLQGNPGASPAAVRTALYAKTTKDIVTSSNTANNDLLFSDF
jgi:subtilisin family serine protease